MRTHKPGPAGRVISRYPATFFGSFTCHTKKASRCQPLIPYLLKPKPDRKSTESCANAQLFFNLVFDPFSRFVFGAIPLLAAEASESPGASSALRLRRKNAPGKPARFLPARWKRRM